MSAVKYKEVPERAENNAVCIERTFPHSDSKGRQFGAYVNLWEMDLVALTPEEIADREKNFRGYTTTGEPGHYFVMRTQATRGGSSYGAVQSERLFRTSEEREKALAKYFRDAEKRCPKIIAKEQAKARRKAAGLRS